ncbi:MAG TPA: type II secretion system protein [bacterium]|jgi:type II secretory pathway pseudopilin PulG
MRTDSEKLRETDTLSKQEGYTLIEMLGVAALMIILVLATQGMTKNFKRYSIEETASQRLKSIAQAQTMYRYSNDPVINPSNSYGTFLDLQNADLIPDFYEQDDEKRHTVNAYIPNYRLEFLRAEGEFESEPDQFRYFIRALPLYNSLKLKTFYMSEDGEVYWRWNEENADRLFPYVR